MHEQMVECADFGASAIIDRVPVYIYLFYGLGRWLPITLKSKQYQSMISIIRWWKQGIFEELAKENVWQQQVQRQEWLKSRHIKYYFLISEPMLIQN